MKFCSKCDTNKSLSNFHKDNSQKDGHFRYCKECSKKRRKKRYSKNKDSILKQNAEYKVLNYDYIKIKNKEYYSKNIEIEKIRKAQWKKANSEYVNFWKSQRRAKKLLATPAWADKDKILEFFKEAQKLTEETGIKHHVDHIVPLVSKLVCGLHCEANLQVLTAFENLSKGNHYWPNMPWRD